MPRATPRRLPRLLAAAGAGAIAAAVLMDAWSGAPLTIGWTQLFLLVLGGTFLIAALPPVWRMLMAQLETSSALSDSTRAELRRHPRLYLAHSLWFAAVLALGEIGLRTYETAAHKKIHPLDYLWTIPAGYLVLSACLGLAFTLIARRWTGRLLLTPLVFSFAFVGLGGVIVIAIRGLQPVAAVLLAAGLAVQLARLTTRHAYLFHAVVRTTVVPVSLVLATISAGAFAWPHLRESRALSGIGPARAGSPNVLLLVLDTVRAKSLSLHGYARSTTPNLDRFAARGVVFDRAMATSPWTLPSHGSMFTGRYPDELTGAWLSPIDRTHPTLAEALHRRGYQTAGFIANTTYCGAEFGLARGFAHYEDHRVSARRVLLAPAFVGRVREMLPVRDRVDLDRKAGMKSAEDINSSFLTWLGDRRRDRPYFAFLNYYDAHAPYLSPAEFGTRFSSRRPRGDIWSRPLDAWAPHEVAELNDAYDATIAYLDHQIGLLFSELERLGELRDTIVIVTSDHGELFGEHGLLEHANSLYLPLLHVPLVVVGPAGIPADTRVKAPVSLRDLPATIMDLAGFGTEAAFPGASLTRTWAGDSGGSANTETWLLAEVEQAYPAYPASYPARKGRLKSVTAGGLHYIRNYGTRREELYDLADDPDELRDLASIRAETVAQYRSQLEAILASRGRN